MMYVRSSLPTRKKGLLLAFVLALVCMMVAVCCHEARAASLAPDQSDAQPSRMLTIDSQSSSLETQSTNDYFYISSPSKGDAYTIGDTVDIVFRADMYFFWNGYAVTNYMDVKVTQNGTKVLYDYASYEGVGSFTKSFTPTKPGTYKIEDSRGGFGHAAYADFEPVDSVTIKVTGFSSITPDYLQVNRFKKSRVKVNWNKTGPGAKVYRSTSFNGKYKLVKTTTASSFTDKVNAKTNYYYKIRYYQKVGSKLSLSKPSAVVAAYVTPPAKPTIRKATKTAKGVKLNWKMKGDCNAIFILRASKKNGMYQFIDGVEGTTRVFVDKTAKAGKTYWYKVESKNWLAFKNADATEMSAPVKIKA